MLKKGSRATTKEVNLVFKKGAVLFSPHLAFEYTRNTSEYSKFSFIVPKSIAKKAIERSRLRRKGYTAIRANAESFPKSIIGVFALKKYQDNSLILTDEIKNIFDKVN